MHLRAKLRVCNYVIRLQLQRTWLLLITMNKSYFQGQSTYNEHNHTYWCKEWDKICNQISRVIISLAWNWVGHYCSSRYECFKSIATMKRTMKSDIRVERNVLLPNTARRVDCTLKNYRCDHCCYQHHCTLHFLKPIAFVFKVLPPQTSYVIALFFIVQSIISRFYSRDRQQISYFLHR